LFRRGAPGQGAGRSQHRDSRWRSHRKKGYTLPPKNTNTRYALCLKAPFWHQKVHSKAVLTHIFDNIMHKNNNLSGSDPAIPAIAKPNPTTLDNTAFFLIYRKYNFL